MKQRTNAGLFLRREMIKRRTAMFDVVQKTGISRGELQTFFEGEMKMTESFAKKLSKNYAEYSQKFWLNYEEPILLKEKREMGNGNN